MEKQELGLNRVGAQGFEAFDITEQCEWEEVGQGEGWRCRVLLRTPNRVRHVLSFRWAPSSL